MNQVDAHSVQLLAQIDALVADLRRWRDNTPPWSPAQAAAAAIDRLQTRTEGLRVRFDAPLVVATLGGTGTGKSTLINALVGLQVTDAGRQRPTTRQPVLVTRPDLRPEWLGIDPAQVHHVTADAPALADYVLIDCPDPDTTETGEDPTSNLARLRQLLPHCDVLLVTSTQQKYRSACVAGELAEASRGARLVFVQTHADVDADIREDWQHALGAEYATGDMFLIDGPAALRDAQQGIAPRGEFGRLVQWLGRQLSAAARVRIRRANLLELIDTTLAACREQLEPAMPAIVQLEQALVEQRRRLARQLTAACSERLEQHRRAWEGKLLAEIADRWGFSPFSALIRLYLGLGSLLSGLVLWRMRSSAQLALWGALEGTRRWRQRRAARAAELQADGLAVPIDDDLVRAAAVIVDGYVADAHLPRSDFRHDRVIAQAVEAAEHFSQRVAADAQQIAGRLATQHAGWFTRLRYELLFSSLLIALVYRFGKNFFYDTWLGPELGWTTQPAPLLGTDFLLGAALAVGVWSALLLWMFTARLRRGLSAELERSAKRWEAAESVAGWFAELDDECRQIRHWHTRLLDLEQRADALIARLAETPDRLGHRVVSAVGPR